MARERATATAATLIAATTCACVEVRELRLPVSEQARSALVAYANLSAGPVLAIDLIRREPAADLVGGGENLFVLEYSRELSEFQLQPGAVFPPQAGEPFRPLPAFQKAWKLDPSGEWIEHDAAQTRTALQELRLPPFDERSCETCIVYRGGEPTCTTECAPDAPSAPQAPESPEPVDLGPCPKGWSPADTDRLTGGKYCRPAARAACAGHEIQLAGDSSCRTAGADCPPGQWPEGLPPNALYVIAGAAPGGSGTLAAPFARLSEALTAAAPGAVIALGKGISVEDLRIDNDVEIAGACAEAAIIRGTVTLTAPGATLRNLTVESNQETADTVVAAAGHTTLEGVSITAGRAGISVRGTLTARDVVVRRASHAGLEVTAGSVEISRASFENNTGAGITLRDEASATLEDIAILATTVPSRAGGNRGWGLYAEDSILTATNIYVEESDASGIHTKSSTLTLTGAFIRTSKGIDGAEMPYDGLGLRSEGGRLDARSVVTIDAKRAGLLVDASSKSEVQKLIALGKDQIHGVLVRDAELTLEGVIVEGGTRYGILLQSSVSTISDYQVFDTGKNDQPLGAGVVVDGNSATLIRGRIERTHQSGFGALRSGTRQPPAITLRDLTIHGVASSGDAMPSAYGMQLKSDVALYADRVSIDTTGSAGLQADLDPGSLNISDLHIRNSNGFSAANIAGNGAVVTISRVALHPATGCGLLARSGSIAFTDLLVEGATSRDLHAAAGIALEPRLPGEALTVSVDRFRISNNKPYGINVVLGDISLSQGVIEQSDVGIHSPADRPESLALREEVVFRDNLENLVRY